jgi:hypothetical protein
MATRKKRKAPRWLIYGAAYLAVGLMVDGAYDLSTARQTLITPAGPGPMPARSLKSHFSTITCWPAAVVMTIVGGA